MLVFLSFQNAKGTGQKILPKSFYWTSAHLTLVKYLYIYLSEILFRQGQLDLLRGVRQGAGEN